MVGFSPSVIGIVYAIYAPALEMALGWISSCELPVVWQELLKMKRGKSDLDSSLCICRLVTIISVSKLYVSKTRSSVSTLLCYLYQFSRYRMLWVEGRIVWIIQSVFLSLERARQVYRILRDFQWHAWCSGQRYKKCVVYTDGYDDNNGDDIGNNDKNLYH